jgi:hypothetical protein
MAFNKRKFAPPASFGFTGIKPSALTWFPEALLLPLCLPALLPLRFFLSANVGLFYPALLFDSGELDTAIPLGILCKLYTIIIRSTR